LSTPAAASGAPYWTFHTAAVRRARIYKLICTNTQTVFSQLGVIRASNTPVATTSTVPQAYDPADAAATAALDTAWSTPPTVGANFLWDVSIGPAQGSGVNEVWQADKEITVAQSSWLVGWNPGAGAGGILTVSIAYEE